ncbi:hypothetical protein RIEGSTA812A_PEG_209 [invertebrate metagenome]|uniref:Uncharacterized protein n=1 Tax=invertebrate metagenome TaxID=1711999 RepID=A0A484H4I9_9ZZZZ
MHQSQDGLEEKTMQVNRICAVKSRILEQATAIRGYSDTVLML